MLAAPAAVSAVLPRAEPSGQTLTIRLCERAEASLHRPLRHHLRDCAEDGEPTGRTGRAGRAGHDGRGTRAGRGAGSE